MLDLGNCQMAARYERPAPGKSTITQSVSELEL